MAKGRDYDREMELRTAQDITDQSTRHKARRAMIKKVGASAVAGKDVHHRSGLKGGNGHGNLAVMDRSKNRRMK